MSEDKEPTLIEQIFVLKGLYYDMKPMIDGTEELDPMIYPDLLEIRKNLSCLSLDLALEVSKSTREMIKLESSIEFSRYKSQSELIASGKGVGESESISRALNKNDKEKLAVAKGLHKTGEMILKQVNEILFSLRQEISIVKKEWEKYAEQ